jgi:hypothetical protein
MIDFMSYSGGATVLIILFFILTLCYFFFGSIRHLITGILKSLPREKRRSNLKHTRQRKNAIPFFGFHFTFRMKRKKTEKPVKLRVVGKSKDEPVLKDDRARLYIVRPRSVK